MNHHPAIWSARQPAELLASRNFRTSELRFPPYRADSVLATDHQQVRLASTGRLYSFTTIHPNPKSGEPPFALGYVDLPGPVRIFGRIRGEAIQVDARCEVVPDEQFGYVFRTLPA